MSKKQRSLLRSQPFDRKAKTELISRLREFYVPLNLYEGLFEQKEAMEEKIEALLYFVESLKAR